MLHPSFPESSILSQDEGDIWSDLVTPNPESCGVAIRDKTASTRRSLIVLTAMNSPDWASDL